MEKKHLIMGTAGHIDHGKTSLIRALTGYDCDTHKQEKERGITINLGFSHLDLPSGNSVGIVDVPGHADFINTMVAGASGIDFVLLIISADEGVMPQTKEHLNIMKVLNVKSGIVVLTKMDLVDEELLELAIEEVNEFVEGSFLQNAPIIPVSSISMKNIKKLINEIENLFQVIQSKDVSGYFRMFIDRIFSIKGFGTIVNGSVLSGSLSKEDSVFLLPKGDQLRIRRIEKHGQETDKIFAGDRASLNLVGLKRSDFQKGMLLSSKYIKPTNLIDANITLFENDISIGLWSQVLFILGTIRIAARIHLLDKNKLLKGESGLVQIYLPEPILTVFGDKFIIRNSSKEMTIGGGTIIDVYPLHHRRRRKEQIDIVEKLSGGDYKELIATEVRKSISPVTEFYIADKINIFPEAVEEIIKQGLPEDIEIYHDKESYLLLKETIIRKLKRSIIENLHKYHDLNPFVETGRNFTELLGIFRQKIEEIHKRILKLFLAEMINNGKLKKVNNTWALKKHSIVLDKSFMKQEKAVEDFLNESGHQLPNMDDFATILKLNNINDKTLRQIYAYLQNQKKICFIEKFPFRSQIIESAKKMVTILGKENSQGFTLAQFRDEFKTNRKTATFILEYFDNEGITYRKENSRFLTKKFLSLVNN